MHVWCIRIASRASRRATTRDPTSASTKCAKCATLASRRVWKLNRTVALQRSRRHQQQQQPPRPEWSFAMRPLRTSWRRRHQRRQRVRCARALLRRRGRRKTASCKFGVCRRKIAVYAKFVMCFLIMFYFDQSAIRVCCRTPSVRDYPIRCASWSSANASQATITSMVSAKQV